MKMMNRAGAQPSLPSLLLCCHTDVVPATESLWTQPAFDGTLVDGKIFGRGAQDMKSVGVQVNRQSDFGRPSPTLHNVYIGQFFFLSTEGGQKYLKIFLPSYHSTYICPNSLG